MATMPKGPGSGAATDRGLPPLSETEMDLDMMLLDARRWREAAEDLKAAQETAQNLVLTAWDFSFLADQQGATEVYRKVQQKLTRLLAEGHQVMAEMGDRLEGVVDAAETTEAENRARLLRVQDLIEEL